MKLTGGIVLGLVTVAVLGAMGGEASPDLDRGVQGVEERRGRALGPAGQPLPWVFVTASADDGRAETVMAGPDGGFTLPASAGEGWTVRAHRPGYERGEAVPVGAGPVELRTGPATSALTSFSGAAFLARLPQDDERTRQLQVDCTACHVFNEFVFEASGHTRTREEWRQALSMMIGLFGPGTGFPIVSEAPDPESWSTWLAETLPATTDPVRYEISPEELAEGVRLTEYDLPVPQDLPHDLVYLDGTVWITGMFTHQLYALDPETGNYTTEAIPVQNANPRAIEADAQGRLYPLLGAPGRVARFDPASGEWEDWSADMYGHSIILDEAGGIWTNGHFTHAPERIVRIDPETGERTFFEVPRLPGGGAAPTESTIPYGLRVDFEGRIWGTQLRGNRILRLDPSTGEVDQWEVPISHAGPRRPDPAADGALWVPLYGANGLARFDPTSEDWEVWDFPVPGALPYIARIDHERGRVWVATGHGDVIAIFDPATERFELIPLPTRGALIRHIDVDEATGDLWAAYGASPGIPAKILRISLEE